MTVKWLPKSPILRVLRVLRGSVLNDCGQFALVGGERHVLSVQPFLPAYQMALVWSDLIRAWQRFRFLKRGKSQERILGFAKQRDRRTDPLWVEFDGSPATSR